MAGVIEPSGGNNAIVDSTGLPKASTDFVGFYVKKDNVGLVTSTVLARSAMSLALQKPLLAELAISWVF